MKNPKSLQGKSNLTLFNFRQERKTAENQENKKKLQTSSSATSFGGKEGIRTLEALLTLTRFPGGPLQPLEHLSVDDF